MIHYGLSYDEYAALPGWRWSDIKLLDKSPRAVQHNLQHPRPDTAGLTWLRAVHCAVLEPDRFVDAYSVYVGTRRGKLYEAHKLAHPGQEVLNEREHKAAMATAKAVADHPAAHNLMYDGEAEVSFTWDDAVTGLPCKGRLDWLVPSGPVVDLKTTFTVNERAVASMTARNLWHGQMAHYCAGLDANNLGYNGACILSAEGKGAHDVAVFQLANGAPDGPLYVGGVVRARFMSRLAECVASGKWPGRHEEAQDLCLPSYALDEPEITFGEDGI